MNFFDGFARELLTRTEPEKPAETDREFKL